MASGYVLHQGHRCTDCAMTWLGRRAKLWPHSVLVLWHISLAATETNSTGHYK